MPLCGDDHTKLMQRLNRIEGQVRGVKKMVAGDRDCMEVLKQVAAASGALRSLGMFILQDHLKGCVVQAVGGSQQQDELISQVMDIFGRFSR